MMPCRASQTIVTDRRFRFSGLASRSIRRLVLIPSSGRSTIPGLSTGPAVYLGSRPTTPPVATSAATVE